MTHPSFCNRAIHRRLSGGYADGILIELLGSVALFIGLTIPILLIVINLDINVAPSSPPQVELQRVADTTAPAGSKSYSRTSNAQSATDVPAHSGELGDVAGAANRSWNMASQTLMDNDIVAAVVGGFKITDDAAVEVIARLSVPPIFAPTFSSRAPVLLWAGALSELVLSSRISLQPCLVAQTISSGGDGGISLPTPSTVRGSDCFPRSNAEIAMSGSGSVDTAWMYAAGLVSIPFYVPKKGIQHNLNGRLSDR